MKRSERRRNDKRTVISSLCKRQEGLDLLMRWKRRRKTSRFSGRLIHRTRLHVVLKYNLCTIISADCTLGRNKASLSRPHLARGLFHPNSTINAEETRICAAIISTICLQASCILLLISSLSSWWSQRKA